VSRSHLLSKVQQKKCIVKKKFGSISSLHGSLRFGQPKKRFFFFFKKLKPIFVVNFCCQFLLSSWENGVVALCPNKICFYYFSRLRKKVNVDFAKKLVSPVLFGNLFNFNAMLTNFDLLKRFGKGTGSNLKSIS
jgi:hypothetical protein